MAGFDATTLLLQLGILLAAAFLLGRLAERIGLPATTGELTAGLLLGPSVLGAFAPGDPEKWLFTSDSEHLEPLRGIALFCGVLLVGVAGATLEPAFVRANAKAAALISVGALMLPLAVTLPLAALADPRLRGDTATGWTFAVFAGLALSVSAVPVIVKIFADLGVLHRNLSQLSLSVAVIDDATVWVGLSALTAFVHLGGGAGSWTVDTSVAVAAAGALVLVTVVARRSSAELGVGPSCLLAATFITLGAVWTSAIGLDSTLGAFACGAVVASGWLVPVNMLTPLRTVVLGVLAPLFLAANALSADLTALRDPALAAVAVAAVVVAVATKTVGAYAGARLAHLERREALAVASALNARGTVQLVVAAAGLHLGLLSAEGFTVLVLVALITSAMAGPLIRRYMRDIPPSDDEQRRGQLID